MILLFCSAWVAEENLWPYKENREQFMPTQRVPRGFQDAVDAIEQLLKKPTATSAVSSFVCYKLSYSHQS